MPSLERWGFEKRFRTEHAEWHPKQRAAYEQMKDRLKCRGAIVALIGDRGLGKTTLAAQWAIETAFRNEAEKSKPEGPRVIQHVIHKKLAKLIQRYKPLYADFGSTNSEALMDSLEFLCQQQEFLVIDELHDCDDLKVKTRLLTDIVDRRYARCRDTILIANQKPAEFVASTGDSIISRLTEHGCIIPCDWPSYRTAQP